jgi:hypothetical protein
VSSRSRRLLWLIPALSLGFGVAAIALQAAIPAEQLPREDRLDAPDVLFPLGFVAYAIVGALIAARHPRNAVGWLFCAVGVMSPVTGFLWAYALYSVEWSALPGETAAAWAFAWSSEPLLSIIALLLLLFPNGRFLSPRWRVAAFVALAAALIRALAIALDPGPLYTFKSVSNPVGLEGAGGALEAIAAIAAVASTALLAAGGISVVVRYRRASARERRQIKWLAFTAAFAVLMLLSFTALELVAETDRGTGEVITSILAFLTLAAIPTGAGIAMLRHRLYDIDVVIRRTVVYGALTATLVGAYLGMVLLLQLALSPESDIAIAGSTLAVAALVRPARRRIQELVDRRFYRSRYDAAQTLESFGARLRDEVDLDALGGDLRSVVADTMQPAHVSLWLRGAPR